MANDPESLKTEMELSCRETACRDFFSDFFLSPLMGWPPYAALQPFEENGGYKRAKWSSKQIYLSVM